MNSRVEALSANVKVDTLALELSNSCMHGFKTSLHWLGALASGEASLGVESRWHTARGGAPKRPHSDDSSRSITQCWCQQGDFVSAACIACTNHWQQPSKFISNYDARADEPRGQSQKGHLLVSCRTAANGGSGFSWRARSARKTARWRSPRAIGQVCSAASIQESIHRCSEMEANVALGELRSR